MNRFFFSLILISSAQSSLIHSQALSAEPALDLQLLELSQCLDNLNPATSAKSCATENEPSGKFEPGGCLGTYLVAIQGNGMDWADKANDKGGMILEGLILKNLKDRIDALGTPQAFQGAGKANVILLVATEGTRHSAKVIYAKRRMAYIRVVEFLSHARLIADAGPEAKGLTDDQRETLLKNSLVAKVHARLVKKNKTQLSLPEFATQVAKYDRSGQLCRRGLSVRGNRLKSSVASEVLLDVDADTQISLVEESSSR